IDLGNVVICEFLDLIQTITFVILRDNFVLRLFLERIIRRVPYISDRDAMVLGYLVYLLCELFTTFLIQWRNRKSNDLSVVRRIEAQVRGDDGLFDSAYLRHVPRLHGDQLRLRHSHGRHLDERRQSAVIVDVDRVEQTDGRAPRSYISEFSLEILYDGLHFRPRVIYYVRDTHSLSFISSRRVRH